MTLFHTTFSTPLGPFSVAVTEQGELAATAFGNTPQLLSRMGRTSETLEEHGGRTSAARDQIVAYFSGELSRFELPLRWHGTPFQQRVWTELQSIPYGKTQTYGALAAKLGSSPRAVGGANAANPICLVVPCHRVVGSDGSLTGFAFGEEIKHSLIEHERGLSR